MLIKNRAVKMVSRKSGQVLDKIQGSDDPLKELGPGISSYHWLLTRLIFIFFALCLVHIPVMEIYQSYGQFNSDPDAGFSLQTSLKHSGSNRHLHCLSRGAQRTWP